MSIANSVPGQLGLAHSAHPDSAPADVHCRHEVQFYFDDRFLTSSLSVFIGTALESGSPAVVVATKAHRDALAQHLERTGVGLAAAVAQGRYLALDAAETLAKFMVNGVPDKGLFREAIGGVLVRAAAAIPGAENKVAVYGEMVTLLWQNGQGQAAIELEQLWNGLSESHAFYLRCGYPLSSFDREAHTEAFAKICHEHEVVIPAESYTALVDEEDRLRDIARLQQMEQALKTEAAERRQAQERAEEAKNQNEELTAEVRKRETSEDELRRFTRRLLMARDEEQRSIASELHENTAQLLAALSLYFGVLNDEKATLSPRLASVVASSRSVADSLLTEVRKLSHLLHPPTLDDIGLGPALKEYVEQFSGWSGIKVGLEVASNVGRFRRHIEIAIFRIVEEALANVRQHSGSGTAMVRLSRSSENVTVEIQDYGSGISRRDGAAKAGVGITGMRERARELGGNVRIQSNITGTLVSVTLPTEKDHSGDKLN
jgi:signal transduction histidine kinase